VICAHREEKHFGSLASVDFCGPVHPWQAGSWFGCSPGGRVARRNPVERGSSFAGRLAGPRSLAGCSRDAGFPLDGIRNRSCPGRNIDADNSETLGFKSLEGAIGFDMFCEYIHAALSRATYEIIEDEEPFYGEVPELRGVWANGKTLEECRENLKGVIEGWIALRLRLGLVSRHDHNVAKSIHC